jgi:hypothetical protein
LVSLLETEVDHADAFSDFTADSKLSSDDQYIESQQTATVLGYSLGSTSVRLLYAIALPVPLVHRDSTCGDSFDTTAVAG